MKLDIEQIIPFLPTADESYQWEGVKLDIFLAKNFYTDEWQNESLRLLVLKCRESFYRYGDVEVEDNYDKKSLISIIGVSYLFGNRLVKEWITIRLVPAEGAPSLSEDLHVEFDNHKKLFQLIKEKILFDRKDSEKRLFTVSRFCGISPYFEDDFRFVAESKKIKFTLLSFVLLCKFSMKYIALDDKHYYFTAMFHHNIFDKLGFFHHRDKKIEFSLPDTFKTLSMDQDELNTFFPGPVAFRHPTYFFRIKELVLWIKSMLNENKIDPDSLNLILKTKIDWIEIEKRLFENKLEVVTQLSALGVLFEDLNLRNLLRREVPLSLILKLIHQSELQQKINNFLAEINFSTKYE